ncbi:hypothetical protein HID58_028866, partial [Brassica napus]
AIALDEGVVVDGLRTKSISSTRQGTSQRRGRGSKRPIGSGTGSSSATEGSETKSESFCLEALMSSIFAWNMRGFNKPRKQKAESGDTFLSSFIYESNCIIERRELWSEMEAIAGSVAGTNNSWIIQGDFNVALSVQEHSRAVESAMDRTAMRDFQNVVYKCDMMDLAQQIEAMQNPQTSTFEAASDAWKKWHHISGIEEQFYYQKSRVQWMGLGDRNSRFFHKVTQSQNIRNTIRKIVTADGRILTSQADIKREAASHLENFLNAPQNVHAVPPDVLKGLIDY